MEGLQKRGQDFCFPSFPRQRESSQPLKSGCPLARARRMYGFSENPAGFKSRSG